MDLCFYSKYIFQIGTRLNFEQIVDQVAGVVTNGEWRLEGLLQESIFSEYVKAPVFKAKVAFQVLQIRHSMKLHFHTSFELPSKKSRCSS